jgi:hypothetical protein
VKSIRFLLLAALVVGVGGSSSSRLTANPAPQQIDDIAPSALAQIDALLDEKESRTPAQRKMDSQLLYAVKMTRGQPIALGVRALATDLPYQSDRRVSIDVSADVNAALLAELRSLGVEVVYSDQVQGSLRLLARVDELERIAALPQVVFVQPQQRASTAGISAPPLRRVLDRRKLSGLLRGALTAQAVTLGQGSKTSEGDVTHKAVNARATFNIDGTGVKIGVLSDGVRSLAASQALGDLGTVTVLGNPAPCPMTSTCDEGTAMLEIIHDLAPGAQLFFASAFTGLTMFAQNIRDLRTAGCDIILDDVFYDVESPFQDGQAPGVVSTTNGGVVIQAVKDVTAAGALYFSSAGNSGNLDDGTSGVWEGDFVDGGAAAAPLVTGRVHNFGTQTFNVLTAASQFVNLYWSDPLGGSSNDYDLFWLNSTGTTVRGSSTNIQSGTQDPYEVIGGSVPVGDRIVIVKSNAAASRFLHLDTNRGRLSIATSGATHGHAATSAANSFGVAATPALAAFPSPFNSSDHVETFSSDGPRRIFFTANGSAITPGNVSATGGQVLNKPDITAADGVSVTGVGGFPTRFFGTSAAAPHAGAIAALVKSLSPSLTASQIRTALLLSVIDIESPGVDRDSGAGIIMADTATSAAAAGTVTAHALDAASGTPLSGASITFNPGGFVITTDGGGNASFLIPPGVYTLTLSASGHALQSVFGVNVTLGGTMSVFFAVPLAPAQTGNAVLNNSAEADRPVSNSVAPDNSAPTVALASASAPPEASRPSGTTAAASGAVVAAPAELAANSPVKSPGEIATNAVGNRSTTTAASGAVAAPAGLAAGSPINSPGEIATNTVGNSGGTAGPPGIGPLATALNRAAVPDPPAIVGSSRRGDVFRQSATSVVSSASARKWEVEVHGGLAFGRSSGGTSALPAPGAPFLTAASTPSRLESSWLFGDGAVLLNQVNTALGIPSRLTPLDPVLGSSALEPPGGGVFGVRVSRVITPRLTAEWTAEYGFRQLEISSSAQAGLEISRASFVSAWSGMATANPSFTNPVVTAVSSLNEGGMHQWLTTGVVNVALKQEGRTIPFITLGGGLRLYSGDAPSAQLVGNYRFVLGGAPIDERDSVTLRFATPHALVAVVGGGLKHNLSSRLGVRLDLRAYLSRSSIGNLVDAVPNVVTSAPAGSGSSFGSPSIQFGNTPANGVQSSLSGPPLSGFQTFTGAFETEISATSGIFWRF